MHRLAPRLARRLLVLLCLALASLAAHAQGAEPLIQQATTAYQAGRHAESAALFAAALEAGADDPSVAYNAACSFALAGQPDAAFRHLALAVDRGWSNTDHLRADTDLTSLHADPRWPALVERAEAGARLERLRWDGAAFETPYRDTLSVEEKVAGLSRLWAEVKFNFINFDLVPTLDWDSLYVATLPRVMAVPTTEAYYGVLTETMAQLRDGHSNVFPPAALAARTYNWPAFRTALVGETVAVTAVYDDALRADGIVPGVEIVAVAGEPVRTYAEATVRPFQSASTAQDLDVRTYDYMLLAGPPGPVALTFQRADGTRFTRTVPRLTREERAAAGIDRQAAPPAFRLSWLPGNVALVELGSFGSDEAATRFAAAFDEIARADALILDVRHNGGGNSHVGGDILAHLTDRPFAVSNWRTLEYRPAFRAWGRGTQTYGESGATYPADASRHYTGPVAVLTGPRTFSAAEDFAVAFDVMERGPIVGEATGGSTGQPLFFSLPGGGSARVTTKRDTYPDGREFVGVGVQPDVAVVPTLADLRAGRDVVLEAALAALRGE